MIVVTTDNMTTEKRWRWFILTFVVTVNLLMCQGNGDNPVDIIVSDGVAKNIVKLNVEGSYVTQTTLFSSITPYSIVYDDMENRLYWMEVSPERIRSSDVDGRNVRLVTDLPSGLRKRVWWQDVVERALVFMSRVTSFSFLHNCISNQVRAFVYFNGLPYGLAVGAISRKLFYTDYEMSVITSMDITGENVNTILNKTQVEYPTSIIVHERERIIIWSDKKTGYQISSSNFDGSDIKRIMNVTESVRGLALDERNDVLYWSEWAGTIGSVFLDGTDRKVIYHKGGMRLYDIALLGNTLYFTVWNDRVHRMLINGSNVEEIQSTSTFKYPFGLVVLANKTLETTTTPAHQPSSSTNQTSSDEPGDVPVAAVVGGTAACVGVVAVSVAIAVKVARSRSVEVPKETSLKPET